jgi:hypothetical protein
MILQNMATDSVGLEAYQFTPALARQMYPHLQDCLDFKETLISLVALKGTPPTHLKITTFKQQRWVT